MKLYDRLLLTGSEGFIGKNLVETSPPDKLIRLDKVGGDNVIKVDLCDPNPEEFVDLNTNIAGTIHLAAESCVFVPEDRKEAIIQDNLKSFENAVKLTAKHKGKFVILASSSSVYGGIQEQMYSEKSECKPLGAYGESKLACEKASLQLSEDYGVSILCLRLHNLIGRHQKKSMLPHLVYENILNSMPLEVFGVQQRSWTPIELLDNFLEYAILLGRDMTEKGSVYNFGSKQSVSQLDIIEIAESITADKCNYSLTERRPFEMQTTLPDMSLFESHFGSDFVPQDSSFLYKSMENVLETFN